MLRIQGRGITRIDKCLMVSAVVLLGLSVYVQYIAGDTGDKGWLLLAARMWLQGKKLYIDIFEVNPPLIIWIYAIPVSLTLHYSAIEDYHALVSMALCAIGLSVYISVRIAALHPMLAADRKKQVQFTLLLAFVFIFFTSPVYFFDREHIFVVLTFPYILRCMPSVRRAAFPKYLRVIIGCMAGIGFCIKPHCAVVFFGIQLITMLRERSMAILFTLENVIIYTIALVYLAVVWCYMPEYITRVLPMAWITYSVINGKFGSILFLIPALLTFAITFVDFRLRYDSPYRRDIFYFIAVCAAFLLYALLNNGWGYTYHPLVCMILITTAWVIWECRYLKKEYASRNLPIRQFQFGERACSINFAANSAFMLVLYYMVCTASCLNNEACSKQDALAKVMKDTHARSFGTISIDFGTWSTLTRKTRVEWQTRFNHLWMLPKFFISDADFTHHHHWILDYVAKALADDLNHSKPDIVFVDDTDKFYSVYKHVDLIAYFDFSADFKEAWQHYHYLKAVENCNAPEKKDISISKIINPSADNCRFLVYTRS